MKGSYPNGARKRRMQRNNPKFSVNYIIRPPGKYFENTTMKMSISMEKCQVALQLLLVMLMY
jgi:hypothetical protein